MLRTLFTIIVLWCCLLLGAQTRQNNPWQEIDTLLAHGHYATAYEKSGELYETSKRKGHSHDMLKAVYKQQVAAAAYQEDYVRHGIDAYNALIPQLQGADKSMAHLLFAALTEDKRSHYEAALAESEALKAVRVEDYDLLVEGDTLGLRLRPTLYDVVVHALIDDLYLNTNKERLALMDHHRQLFGTAEEFAQLALPDDTASYPLWQLRQLQALTRHHQRTPDAAVRAHIDHKRTERMRSFARTTALEEEYASGLERIAESYHDSPTEQALFLYLLAEHYAPKINTYTDSSKVRKEVDKAFHMESYIQRIHQIAPDSEWDIMAQALHKQVTHPYLSLQDHTTLLPGQEQRIMLTLRNTSHIAYRIVPRYAGEHSENFNYKEVIGRRSVGNPYYLVEVDLPNAYIYKSISLPLPSLTPGDYFVIATNNGQSPDTKRSSITAISVTNLKMSMMPNEGIEYIGMVLDAATGKAVTECELTLMENSGMDTRFIASYLPDEKGYFTVPMPEGRYRNLYLRASHGGSYTTYTFRYSDFSGHRYWNNEEDTSTLFTFLPDRYTYEPGDTVQLGIIAYAHSEEASSVKSRLPIKVTLTDTRRKELASLQGITDEWGCYNGKFALPKDVTPGRFRLQVTDTTTQRTMFHFINVEAFKAPTFTAKIEQPITTVRFGDSLTLRGTATTYTGMPVTKAKVRYEVSASNMGLFGYQQANGALGYTASDTIYSDEKGHFDIPFKAGYLILPHENATCSYLIKAYITDSSGETQSAQTCIIVGHRTKHANLSKRSGTLLHGDSIGYSLRTLNGNRIAEKVTLRLSKLSVPQHTGIRTSEESDWEQWPEECLFAERSEHTVADSDSHIHLTDDMPCGTYRLTITYTDGEKQHSEHCHFELWREGKGTVSTHVLYTTARNSRDVATGDTAVVYVGTRHSDVYTHYYITVEGCVVDKGSLCLTDETTALRIPIKEEWRNMAFVNFVSVKDNIKRISREVFFIEDKARQLDVHLSTWDKPLEPGSMEQCTISVKDYWGNPVQAALSLSIYDAALDTYGRNYWDIALATQKGGGLLRFDETSQSAWTNNTHVHLPRPTEPRYYQLPVSLVEEAIFYSLAAPATTRGQAKSRAGLDGVSLSETVPMVNDSESSTSFENSENATPNLRQNLRHTALFLPVVRTDAQGQATFRFTAPDLLTRWHVKGIAHTKDLKHGRVESSFVTRKTLMVQPNAPRFLYEGDECHLAVKVTNSSDTTLTADVHLEWLNAGQALATEERSVTLAPNSNQVVSFPLIVPEGIATLTYRIAAHSTRYSDGEQASIAILPRRTRVTETMALYINGKEKREFTFDALAKSHSATLQHHSLTLELTANPLWYALQALPPLCNPSRPNPSSEQLFHRYYGVSIAQHIAQHLPEVIADSTLAPFYNPHSLNSLQSDLLGKLSAAQSTQGGWPWIEGFAPDRYTTLLILKGIGEMETMGCTAIATNDTLYTMVKRGLAYLDHTYHEQYEQMRHKPKQLNSYALYYLYVRSMFPELPFGDIPTTAYHHYRQLLFKGKATQGTLMQKALKMLTLIRLGEHDQAGRIAEVVNQSSLNSDEMGTYWRDNRYAYSWDSNPIATQALLIEAFVRLGQPSEIIGRMQQWLLKQKQTTHWDNTIATAQAVHALISPSGQSSLSGSNAIKVKVGNRGLNLTEGAVDAVQKESLGLIQKQWTSDEIGPALAKVSLEKYTDSPSWGSMTWQYDEDADKVKASGTGFTLTATYYKVEYTDQGEVLRRINAATPLAIGDRVRTRLSFTADRAMDYVELHIHRPAALEPVSTRSGYTYANGLAYYHSVENTRTTCYLYRIEKGSYTIDTDSWVSHTGNYACGLSTIQCMYAPTFMATAMPTSLILDHP